MISKVRQTVNQKRCKETRPKSGIGYRFNLYPPLHYTRFAAIQRCPEYEQTGCADAFRHSPNGNVFVLCCLVDLAASRSGQAMLVPTGALPRYLTNSTCPSMYSTFAPPGIWLKPAASILSRSCITKMDLCAWLEAAGSWIAARAGPRRPPGGRLRSYTPMQAFNAIRRSCATGVRGGERCRRMARPEEFHRKTWIQTKHAPLSCYCVSWRLW